MLDLRVFTDVSVNPKLKVGYGAYLALSDGETFLSITKEAVKTKRFEQTSSTKLELQTLLWALHDITHFTTHKKVNLTIYTDSQNIIGLPKRRHTLEQRDYFTQSNKRLKHYDLYQEFYRFTSSFECNLVKVQGHRATATKDEKDKLFSIVDKASRRALRNEY